MAFKFSPCYGSYVLNQFPCIVSFYMKGFHVSASEAIQGHHGPLVFTLVTDSISVTHLRGGITIMACLNIVQQVADLAGKNGWKDAV